MNESLYNRIGGEKVLRQLVDCFYDLMDSLPEVRVIREMHPQDLTSSRQKLFEFLSGWSGGPPLYVEKHGHPRLRMRHMPFPIGEQERDQWMLCMRKALKEIEIGTELRDKLEANFQHIADFMRNQPEH